MSLDRRLREQYQRTAAGAPSAVDPDALTSAVGRAGPSVGTVEPPRSDRPSPSCWSSPLSLCRASTMAPTVPRTIRPPRHRSRRPAPALDLTFTSVGPRLRDGLPRRLDGDGLVHDQSRRTRFSSPTAQTITVSSEALPDGWSEDRWAADFLLTDGGARARDCFPPSDQWLPVDVGGHPGGLLGGDFGCYLTQAVVFVTTAPSSSRPYPISPPACSTRDCSSRCSPPSGSPLPLGLSGTCTVKAARPPGL